MSAVLFDFSGTLFRIESAESWLRAVLDDFGLRLGDTELRQTAQALESTGALPGGAPAEKIPEPVAGIWRVRDESAALHRAAYTGLSRQVPLPDPRLHDALYDRHMTPAAWAPYPDAAHVLRTLRERGIGVGVVSNIGWDLRPVFREHGLDAYVGTYVLSFEHGIQKPDTRLFATACDALDADPRRTLMVGDDRRADGGAAALGCRLHFVDHLPVSSRPDGLLPVLDLVDAGPAGKYRGDDPGCAHPPWTIPRAAQGRQQPGQSPGTGLSGRVEYSWLATSQRRSYSMSPRSASVNEELRRRSRERLLQAAVELVGERGYDATTLGDIADRAGSARGLASYYFPGKRQLVQSAVHRLMHRTLEEALEREPRTEDGRERLARAVDAILGLARDRPVLMRQHMAGLLQAEGFVQCPEQQRLSELLGDTVARYGSQNVGSDYPMLRAALMGAVFAALVPGVPMPVPTLRADLFRRYGLAPELGVPPDGEASGGTCETDLSRFFATGEQASGQPGQSGQLGQSK